MVHFYLMQETVCSHFDDTNHKPDKDNDDENNYIGDEGFEGQQL